ncbi:MAG: beta-ketoacyl-ACP synthase III [Candidatus Neomarinimicrobiota bacterium]|nr:beta-ketoacyl-ACP synthase III [Candidatus Neomarinimicrobiota bacterium]
MHKSKIIGMGFKVPDNIISNDDLSKMMDTSDDWIQSRSGIKERRWATDKIATSDLALVAANNAISNAEIDSKEIDMVIVGTLSSDYFFPGVSAQLQEKLNLNTIGAFDIKAACSAFVYSISIADQYIKTGMAKTILVVGAETQTKLIEKSTEGRDVAVLFGDGAGAAILKRSEDKSEILSTHLHSEGKDLKNLWMEAPGTSHGSWFKENQFDKSKFTPKMNGREVFRNAVTRFPEVINEALNFNNLDINDIKLIIPHQANYRISEAVAKRLGVGMDKVYSNIHKYGNTTAASIPIALTEAIESGKIGKGDIIILAAFGAGYTWASAAIKW